MILFFCLVILDMFFFPFRRYLNDQHNRIEFTYETESNNSLNLLDVKINKKNNEFSTHFYRKPTFTGLGLR